jgi:outer membrane murein-binding lipoprotein Lpp
VESIRSEVREAEGEEAKLEEDMDTLKREQAALHKDMTRAEREAKKRRDKVRTQAEAWV